LKRESSGRSIFDVKKAIARRMSSKREMSSKGKELFNNAVHKVRERKRVEEDENKSRLAFSDLLAERVDFWQSSRDSPEEQLTLYELLSTVDVHFPEVFPEPLISAKDDIILRHADESDENVKLLLRKYNRKALLRVHPDRQRNKKIETKLLCEILCQVLHDVWSENV
jgi:hypothetical protein